MICFLGFFTLGFCENERFFHDLDKTEQELTQINFYLQRILEKLDFFAEKQEQIEKNTTLLKNILESYEIEEWENSGIQPE
jgi:hypothetical protein